MSIVGLVLTFIGIAASIFIVAKFGDVQDYRDRKSED